MLVVFSSATNCKPFTPFTMQRRNFVKVTLGAAGASVLASAFGRNWGLFSGDAVKPVTGLFLNKKTNVIHIKVLNKTKYHDHMALRNVQEIPVQHWREEIKNIKPVVISVDNEAVNVFPHFDKGKSSMIFENLALRELDNGINSTYLTNAHDVLVEAFSPFYAPYNASKWRLHDLLFKVIVYNDGVTHKWEAYQDTVKAIDFSSVEIPVRNEWVNNKPLFDKKLRARMAGKEQEIEKLKKRIII